MSHRYAFFFLIVAVAMAVLVPTFGALILAHQQAMEEEVARARSVAQEVLRRSEEMSREAHVAEGAMMQLGQSAPSCGPAHVARLARIVLAHKYVQFVGHADGSVLVCSSLGRHEPGIELGPIDDVTSRTVDVRRAVTLNVPGIDEQLFLVFQRDDQVVAASADSPTDIFLDRDDMSVGIFVRSTNRVVDERGPVSAQDPGLLYAAEKDVHFNGAYLRALARSDEFDITAYSTIPSHYLEDRLNQYALVMVPIGLLVGLALAVMLLLRARQNVSLPTVLKQALKKKEFVVHYQPIIDLATGNTVGVEALLRWPAGEGRDLRPELFIRAAEDCGLIERFTEHVIDSVARDCVALLAAHPDLYVSINLSSADLHRESIIASLHRLLATANVRPENVMVEATEHSVVETGQAGAIVRQIRALGIAVAIDDFGTGYSGLAALAGLDANCLKIDKSFVDAIGRESATSDVIPHIINIANSLQMTTIAEGVERESQAEFLRTGGVTLAQGWLYATAMSPGDLLEFLNRRQSR